MPLRMKQFSISLVILALRVATTYTAKTTAPLGLRPASYFPAANWEDELRRSFPARSGDMKCFQPSVPCQRGHVAGPRYSTKELSQNVALCNTARPCSLGRLGDRVDMSPAKGLGRRDDSRYPHSQAIRCWRRSEYRARVTRSLGHVAMSLNPWRHQEMRVTWRKYSVSPPLRAHLGGGERRNGF